MNRPVQSDSKKTHRFRCPIFEFWILIKCRFIEKQKNKNFFGGEKIWPKSFSSKSLQIAGFSEAGSEKMKKIKTKTFFWGIIFDFLQPEFQNEK